MWMNLYGFTHNSLGMHFWEIPALIIGVITLVELLVHSRNQKKRDERFDKERTQRLEAMQKDAAGDTAATM